VVAEAEIVANPQSMSDRPDALPFWRSDAARAKAVVPRVLLRLLRTASAREVLRREWCHEDPLLRNCRT
jgi:hypothetical protein